MRIVSVCLMAAFITMLPAMATVIDTRASGVYSNMHHEGLRTYGIEIFLMYADKIPFVLLQVADKVTSVPVLIRAKMSSGVPRCLDFDVPKEFGLWGHFHGVFENQRLKGTFEGNQTTVDLPRQKSFWQ